MQSLYSPDSKAEGNIFWEKFDAKEKKIRGQGHSTKYGHIQVGKLKHHLLINRKWNKNYGLFFSSCKVRYFRRYETFWCISKLKTATAIWWHYLSNLFFNIHSSFCKHHLHLSSINFQSALSNQLWFLKQPSEKQGSWHFLCGWRSAALVCLLMECKVVLH